MHKVDVPDQPVSKTSRPRGQGRWGVVGIGAGRRHQIFVGGGGSSVGGGSSIVGYASDNNSQTSDSVQNQQHQQHGGRRASQTPSQLSSGAGSSIGSASSRVPASVGGTPTWYSRMTARNRRLIPPSGIASNDNNNKNKKEGGDSTGIGGSAGNIEEAQRQQSEQVSARSLGPSDPSMDPWIGRGIGVDSDVVVGSTSTTVATGTAGVAVEDDVNNRERDVVVVVDNNEKDKDHHQPLHTSGGGDDDDSLGGGGVEDHIQTYRTSALEQHPGQSYRMRSADDVLDRSVRSSGTKNKAKKRRNSSFGASHKENHNNIHGFSKMKRLLTNPFGRGSRDKDDGASSDSSDSHRQLGGSLKEPYRGRTRQQLQNQQQTRMIGLRRRKKNDTIPTQIHFAGGGDVVINGSTYSSAMNDTDSLSPRQPSIHNNHNHNVDDFMVASSHHGRRRQRRQPPKRFDSNHGGQSIPPHSNASVASGSIPVRRNPPARSRSQDSGSTSQVSFEISTSHHPVQHQQYVNPRPNSNEVNTITTTSSTTPYTTTAVGSDTWSHTMKEGERARYSIYHGPKLKKPKYRLKPYSCFPEAIHLTEEEIYADSLKPSQCFVPLKSYLQPTDRKTTQRLSGHINDSVKELFGSPDSDGRIGSLRVEVLGCVSLARQKPDVTVYLVTGDCAFCTDVLQGYRSPMWPNASRRAAIFPLHHAYARLYCGVFDVRVRKNKENDVFCGRVSIDVATLRPNTEYDVTFPLRASSFVYDRRKRGVIRLRFSVHWFNERAAAMSYFRRPVSTLPKTSPLVEGQPTIPCADPKTFRNVAVTVYGLDLPGKYSKNAFRATIREFTLYEQNLRVQLYLLALDAMLYEKPFVSLYLFVSGLYCVYASSIRMVPPTIVGYFIILFYQSYRFYIVQKAYNLGYQPITMWEVIKAIMLDPSRTFRIDVNDEKKKKSGLGDDSTGSSIKSIESFDFDGLSMHSKPNNGTGVGTGRNIKMKRRASSINSTHAGGSVVAGGDGGKREEVVLAHSLGPILVPKRTKRRRSRWPAGAQRRLNKYDEVATAEGGNSNGADDPLLGGNGGLNNGGGGANNVDDDEIEHVDHREFPFAERDAYPKFAVEDALAPGANNKNGSTTRLHGRLSVYYTTAPPSSGQTGHEEDESSYDSDERDDETIVTESGMSDIIYNLDVSFDGEDESVDEMQAGYNAADFFQSGEASAKRRIRLGPPQDNDAIVGKSAPAQVHLKKVEAMVHKFSRSISVEMVHAPNFQRPKPIDSTLTGESLHKAQVEAIKKKKMQYDEFDKLLGLQTKSANPINRIASSFLGPLMRIMRAFIFVGRIKFHILTWRDPFLSFWAFFMMILLYFILLAFPWRPFFFVVVVLCFGPQNVFVRKFLEQKAERAARGETDGKLVDEQQRNQQQRNEDKERPQHHVVGSGNNTSCSNSNNTSHDGGNDVDLATTKGSEVMSNESAHSEVRRGFFGGRKRNRKQTTTTTSPEKQQQLQQQQKHSQRELHGNSNNSSGNSGGALNDTSLNKNSNTSSGGGEKTAVSEEGRPAFKSDFHPLPSNKKQVVQPRSVAVPYSSLKKDRFFDWPPDPTVSRATPMHVFPMPEVDVGRQQMQQLQQQPSQKVVDYTARRETPTDLAAIEMYGYG